MQKMPLTSQQTNHGVGSEDADLESVLQALTAIRAEITDAAMGRRAECVMLNKGPHVLSAVRVLDDILRRMQTHQTQKARHAQGVTIGPYATAHTKRGNRST